MRYLEDHPDAADTVEGITNWWITWQRFKDTKEKVEDVLEYLIEEGVVEKRMIMGGRFVYSRTEKGRDRK